MKIRFASINDVKTVAKVHVSAFPNFFLTSLGEYFLRELYSGFLRHPDGIFLVADDEGKIIGFAAGTSDPDIFFFEIRKQRGLYFFVKALPAIFKHPVIVVRKLVRALLYRGDKPALLKKGSLLSSIGVLPGVVGQSIGRQLLGKFEEAAFSHGAEFVYLTTDEIGNERVNSFYRENGYREESHFIQPKNRLMVRYVKKLVNRKIMEVGVDMENDFLPFALPEIGEEEIAEVCDALRSGWVTTGPKTRQFEKDFAIYLGIDSEAIAVNSATAGLHLALEAIGIQPGDEVITTTLTFTTTGEVIRYLGAHPVFVDIDPVTLNIDVEAIRRAITPKTRAIVPVHYAGLACDMDAIIGLAREHGLRVVEDAAHAFPTRYKQRLVGTLDTDVTVFSFYANKTMTTGEGEMIIAHDPELINRMKVMRLHGINRDAFDRFTSRKPAWFYEVIAPGFKYNLTDIASALGIHQLRKIDRFFERRQQLANRYFEQLAGLPLILPAAANADEGSTHSWHLFIVRLKDSVGIERNAVIEEMAKRGIGTSVHYIPLHRQPYWKETYSLSAEQYPVADKAYQSMISIPLYTKMTDADQDRVVAVLKDILR